MIPLLILLTQTVLHLSQPPEDEFIGRVVVEWLTEDGDDRTMRLVEEFAYQDPSGKLWKVPAGAKINGASIPERLYSVMGPPFVGDYRRASVVHDHHCVERTESWQSVHRMFYDASRAGGVPVVKAKVMYAAVRGWGPRWEQRTTGGPTVTTISIPRPEARPSALLDLATWVTSDDPSLDEIDRRVAAMLLLADTPGVPDR